MVRQARSLSHVPAVKLPPRADRVGSASAGSAAGQQDHDSLAPDVDVPAQTRQLPREASLRFLQCASPGSKKIPEARCRRGRSRPSCERWPGEVASEAASTLWSKALLRPKLRNCPNRRKYQGIHITGRPLPLQWTEGRRDDPSVARAKSPLGRTGAWSKQGSKECAQGGLCGARRCRTAVASSSSHGAKATHQAQQTSPVESG